MQQVYILKAHFSYLKNATIDTTFFDFRGSKNPELSLQLGKSGKWWNLDGDQFGFQTVLSVQNPNWAYPDALYALACPVRYVVESSIQTAVRNLDVYKPDASQTSKIQTSSDFGTSLYTTYIVTNEKSGDSRLDIEICIWMQSFWKASVIWSPTKFFRNSELWNSSSLDRSSLKSLKLFVFVSLCIAKSKKWQR